LGNLLTRYWDFATLPLRVQPKKKAAETESQKKIQMRGFAGFSQIGVSSPIS
jgi:hypothetical protein